MMRHGRRQQIPVSQELWPASQIPDPAFLLQPAAYSLVTTVGSILQLPREQCICACLHVDGNGILVTQKTSDAADTGQQ